MKCSNCQTPNRETARFCRICGLSLLPRCPFCNQEIPLASAFCDQCGRQISEAADSHSGGGTLQPFRHAAPQRGNELGTPTAPQPPAPNLQALLPGEYAAKLTAARETRAMEGERRVVTMLFCDVKGSTEAAGRFDPEEWAGIINGAFECMIAPIFQYEGTVARLMGDGLLAFFGAPVAHEDDPYRAVLAGLEILKNIAGYKETVRLQWGIELDARVGVNTGLVVVGAVGSDLQMEYSALGDAINIAARMEQTAIPGTVQISDETHKLIAPLFEFEDLGFVQVKGKTDPVHTYRPLRPKPGRLRGIEGLESPTIGREKELALLHTALENLHRGVGHLVFLTGEAGIGKSRLIRELKEATHRTALHWYEVAPLSFEATQPYALFRSFLRQVLGLQEMDSAAEILPKLAVMTEQVSTEVREGGLRALALLLGTQDNGDAGSSPDGEAFKRQLFAATREAISGLFSQTPGVIVLDDLHWADPASLELFNHLFPLVETRPILFLCASRPDRDTPVWPVKTTLAETYPHRVTEIPVLPLSSEKSNVLVDHLITTTHLPTQIRSLILERAEGNPFFLEEIVRTLIEDGILVRQIPSAEGHSEWRVVETNLPRLHIPDNLQTLLAARLDRLQEETRRVLQLAAVIGRNFYYRVLEGLTEPVAGLDTQLSTLQRMNMVVEAARLPELEYAFRHTLVQETAYQSILRKQRREFHRQVGEVMEQLFSERLEIYAPILALHFERAGDSARAFRYYRMAGEEASRLYAVKEAISHYIRALDLMKSFAEPLPSEEVCQLWLRLGRAYELDGRYDEALLHYQEMETFAQTHHQQTLELAALAAHATIHAAPTKKFDRTQAITLSQNALALAEQLEDHATEAKIYWNLMMMSGFSGEGEQGYAYGLRSLEIARQYQLKEQLAYTLHDFHRASLIQGKIEEAETMLAEAKDIWRELGNKAMYIDSLISEALFHIIHSEYARGEAACLEAHRLSLEIGNLWGQCYADYTLGFIYYEQGRFNLALEVMPRALRLVESSGFAVPLVDSHCYMGLIYAYLGDFDRGKMHVMEALHHAQERLPAMQTGPLSALAILEFLQGNFEALDHWLGDFRPNPEINSFTGFMRFISEIYRLLAKEKYPELLTFLNEALPFLLRMGGLVMPAEIYRLKGEALWALHQPDEARNALETGLVHARHSYSWTIELLISLVNFETSQKNWKRAEAYRKEAHQAIQRLLAHIPEPALQTSFLARPSIAAILAPPQSVAPRQTKLQSLISPDFAAKLETARSEKSMVGERRIVTMLFCDVKGSTAAAGQLDPEDWAQIMNGVFEYMIRPVYKFEGTVARLMGDAILAFFGAPVAHEDDPQRAILAGMEIVEGFGPYREQIEQEWGVEINVRVGINTGLVMVGAVGSDLQMEYTALGDAINLAARMEQTATPGTVQVSDETYKLAAPVFEWEDLGTVEVKGKTDPIHTYRPLRAKLGRLRGIEGLSAPMVGRDYEFEQLHTAAHHLRQGIGSLVFITGEAGLGKSRLIRELCALQAEDFALFHETVSFSFETAQPYAIFQRLLRRVCGVEETDSPVEMWEKFTPILNLIPADVPDQGGVFETLFAFHGQSSTPVPEGEAFKHQLFDLMESVWRHWTDTTPRVLIFDDLHWTDPASVELLTHLFNLTNTCPLMIVCATRPDRETPAWAAKELAARTYPHRFHEIPLRPLTAADTNALVNQLLTISDLPEKLRTRILEKTDGNPFFIEEVVRTLIENGMVVRETNESGTQWRAVKHVEDIEIPGNLQALLVARIDRLEEGARRTLQLASVIGRSFYFRVLDAINRTVSAMENELDYQLLTLQQAELIREAARTPELEYMFKHVLTQEAAYSTILLRQRRKFHQQAGEAIERLFPERLDEFASLLAHHFGEAHDPRAARYEMLAGDAAYRVYAIPEAISHYEKVLRFFKQASGVLDKNLGHVFIRLGRCLELQSRYAEALDLYAEMTALARERGDEALELEALIVQGKVYAVPNHYQNPEKAQNFSDRALFLAQKLGDLRAEARIEWNFQLLKMYTGKMDAGIPHGERAIVLAQKLGMRDIEAHALQDLGLAYMAVGELAKTQNVLERARPIWQALGNLPMVVENFANASYERIMAGDFEEALRLSQRSFDLAKEIQNQWGQVNSRVFTSQAFLALGKIDQVNEIQNYFIPLARGFGHPGSALVLVQKAWTYANLGNFALAKEAADEAIQDSKTFAPFHAYALAVRAWYEIQDGNLPTAEQLLAQSVEIIGYNKTLIEIDILLTYIQTEMQLAQGQIADALEKVSALVTYLKQARILYFLPETLALKARLELRLDQAAVADQSLTEAYQIACTINFRTQAWKLAATLAQRAEQTGQLAQAEGFRQEAKIMVAFICENIQDQDVLARFKVFVEENGVSLPQHQN